MTDIYLSHSPDDRLWAGKLAGLLENAGYDVWREVSAIPGEDLVEARLRYRNAAASILVVWPEDVLATQWVEADFQYGLSIRKMVCVAAHIDWSQSICPDENAILLGALTHKSQTDNTGFQALLEKLNSICPPSRPSKQSAAAKASEIARRREQQRKQRAEKAKANAAARRFRQRSADQSSEKPLRA